MSVVNYDEINKIALKTNGTINEDILNYAKQFLINRIKPYITAEQEYKIVKDKILNIEVILIDSNAFKQKYADNGGKGLLPGAYYHNGLIYFKNDLKFSGFEVLWERNEGDEEGNC